MTTTAPSNKWFVRPLPNDGAETRIFLFPYVGGGPAVYGKWPAEFGSHIETFIAHYPGRGSRYNEPPIHQAEPLVEEIAQAIQPYLDKSFAFFGHSFGGLIAYELAKQIQPQVLFISGCAAPHLTNPHPQIHHLSDSEFIKVLQERNAVPDEIAGNAEVMELFSPMLRADFEAFENYRPNKHQLNCPIIAFGGIDDPSVSRERLESWSTHTTAKFRSRYFPGDHFFINASKADVIASISSELTPTHAER